MLLASVLSGCGSGVQDAPSARPRTREANFLLSPLDGYGSIVRPSTEQALENAYRELLTVADTSGPREAAAALLAMDRNLYPAQVLAAQIEFVEGKHLEAAERLEPVCNAQPGYRAAQLLRGRASELAGGLVEAYAAYSAVAESVPTAAHRAREIRPRVLEIVSNRIGEDLRRGRVDDAVERLERLTAWAPDDPLTLEATKAVAAMTSDPTRELAALRALTERDASNLELLERRAALELEVGDAGTGVEIYERLAAASPDDVARLEQLADAKFRWRLQLLPSQVQQLAASPELTRADFAVLLYWLFPGVRYVTGGSGQIATDVLEHPDREQIVRVVNLGLMKVDPTLHQFDPLRPVRRQEVLASLLMLIGRQERGVACLGDIAEIERQPADLICRVAAACGLIVEVGECLPAATVSGRLAVDQSRRAQDQIAAR